MLTINDKEVLKSHPVDLFSALNAEFGKEDNWMEWDSETLLLQLPSVTGPIAKDKVLAVKGCAFNLNVPCSQSIGFEKTCKAFNNNVCVMDAYQPLFVEEAFYGAQQIRAIAQIVHAQEVTFNGEVPAYVAAVAKTRSVLVLPKPLEFAEDLLTFLTGYTKTPDEITLVDSLEDLAVTNPEQLFDKEMLDSLSPQDSASDATIAHLIGCYLYDPRSV